MFRKQIGLNCNGMIARTQASRDLSGACDGDVRFRHQSAYVPGLCRGGVWSRFSFQLPATYIVVCLAEICSPPPIFSSANHVREFSWSRILLPNLCDALTQLGAGM